MIALEKLQKLQPRARLLIATAVAIALAGALWAVKAERGGDAHHQPADAVNAQLIRRGGAIFVPEGSPYRARIAVAPVQQKSISRSKLVTGAVEADPTRTVKILAPVAGRVASLDVSLGDAVKKGQRLASIDSGDLAQAVADAEKARATVKLTKSAFERATGLNKAGGLALRELEQAQNDYRQATTELKRAEARLEVIGDSGTVSGQRQIVLTAPIDGTITALETAPGDFIDNATESMMTISNLEKVWVTASVQEKDLSFVQKDERVEVTLLAYPGEVFSGKVQVISQLLEADTRRNKVRISFDNPYGIFKLNMFASVRFFAPAAQSLLIPSSALFIVNDTTSVFVETAPWTFQRKPVVIEADYEGSTIVRGLEPGQRIVVRGGVLLND
ncbi:efflux RND transporter periplasmic adaptor subunit [Methylocystis sp. JAN1]|uniref:efflux RND transporter periplasmic adaptor subunit n=1 Tax=Methylocystis sp. JAN1 TaxID=3397211 RepID=UPI003FA2C027